MKIIRFYIAVFWSLISLPAMADSPESLNAISNLILAHAQWQSVQYQAMLQYGQAELARAQAAGEIAVADAVRIRTSIIQEEYNKYKTDDRWNRLKLDKIEISYTAVNYYFRKPEMGPAAVDAFERLLTWLPVKVVKAIMFVKSPEFSDDDFIPNKEGKTSTKFKGGSNGQFLTFLKKNDFNVEAYSTAHEHLLDMLGLLNDEAIKQAKQIEADHTRLQINISDLFWKHPVK